MKNPFIRLFRARDKPDATDSVSSAPTFYFGSNAAGKSVTASTAIQMSTVYACVRVIAETIASLPLHVYQNRGEGSVKALDHPQRPKSDSRVVSAAAGSHGSGQGQRGHADLYLFHRQRVAREAAPRRRIAHSGAGL